MNRRTLIGAAAVGCAMLITGCQTYPAGFVDKSLPVEQGKYAVIGDEVEGSDVQVAVFGWGLGMPGSPQRRAYKQALEKSGGADGLIEMAVDQQLINLSIVHIYTTRVTGTPIKVNK